jgi:hypothetical protein
MTCLLQPTSARAGLSLVWRASSLGCRTSYVLFAVGERPVVVYRGGEICWVEGRCGGRTSRWPVARTWVATLVLLFLKVTKQESSVCADNVAEWDKRTMALAVSYTHCGAPYPSMHDVCVPFPLPYACRGWLEPPTNTRHPGMWIKQISLRSWRLLERPPYTARGLLRGCVL